MTARPATLFILLLAWMLLVGAAAGLILQSLSTPPASVPRRTRPPAAEVVAGALRWI